ncbi:hypothetical protein [Saccharibacillus deserti]|uniref:hypothetical protein n=1 Tax=Saccharibacillus deserti TaxID=1634444 RepID=UPI001555D450|nr:hypothetical protein [Saccharibacillus deserti]
MNTRSKTSSKLLLILFGLNAINGLIMMINNFNEKRGSAVLGFLILVISVVLLILLGRDLYKMKSENEKGYKN